jgi:hypothetical protein
MTDFYGGNTNTSMCNAMASLSGAAMICRRFSGAGGLSSLRTFRRSDVVKKL